jgi:hypothetical protein
MGGEAMSERFSIWAAVSGLAVAIGAWPAAPVCAIRPWHRRWGATGEQAEARMSGYDTVLHANFGRTRAIEIDAPAEAVWPWLGGLGKDERMPRCGGRRHELLPGCRRGYIAAHGPAAA